MMKLFKKSIGGKGMKKVSLVFLLCILGIMIAFAGCSSSQSGGYGPSGYSPQILPQAKLNIQMTGTDSSWSFGLGCYWDASGVVYNSGNAAANNVQVIVNLIDTNTNSIRDSESVFIGTIQSGASVPFDARLDGECSKDYRISASIHA